MRGCLSVRVIKRKGKRKIKKRVRERGGEGERSETSNMKNLLRYQ